MFEPTKPAKKLDLSTLDPPLNVTVIDSVDKLVLVTDFMSRTKEFSVDTETNIVDSFFDRRVRTIQIGNKAEQYVIDLLPIAGSPGKLRSSQGYYMRSQSNPGLVAVADALRPCLDSDEHIKVGFNLLFDYIVLSWCLGVQMWHLYDCYLVEKIIHCGLVPLKMSGFWALDDAVKRYFNLEISKEEQKTFDLETPLTESQINYAAFDVRIPLAVKQCEEKIVTKDKLDRVCKIEFDAIPAFGDMHMNGMKVDTQKWLSLVGRSKEKLPEVIKGLDEVFIPLVGKKHGNDCDLDALEEVWRSTKDREARSAARRVFIEARKAISANTKAMGSYEGEAAINYGSGPQLLKALWKIKGLNPKVLPNTSDETLEKFKDVQAIALLREYREHSKIIHTYGEKFLEDNVNPNTGCIHSRVDSIGAETGRTSSSNPNMQNIPSDAEWRSCFIAKPGNKVVTSDYSGQELRIATEFSRQQSWVDAFNKGWDLHSMVAEVMYGDEWLNGATSSCAYLNDDHKKCSCPTHKELRTKVKAINFGIVYGMMAPKLAADLSISLEEAKALLKKYYEANPELIAYLDKAANLANDTMESRTLSGRRRKYSRPDWAMSFKSAQGKLKKYKKKDKDGNIRTLPNNMEVASSMKGIYEAIKRQGKNGPVQGTGVDMVKMAMGCGVDKDGEPFLWHKLRKMPGAVLVNMVHDELVHEAPEGKEKELLEIVESGMMRAGAELVSVVRMEVESHIADCWQK